MRVQEAPFATIAIRVPMSRRLHGTKMMGAATIRMFLSVEREILAEHLESNISQKEPDLRHPCRWMRDHGAPVRASA